MKPIWVTLSLGEKTKIYPQVLTSSIKPQIWPFHVVVLLTTERKWTKMKRCTCRACKVIVFFPLNMQICDVHVAASVVVAKTPWYQSENDQQLYQNAEQIFCSLNLLFCDVPVAVVVVPIGQRFLRSLSEWQPEIAWKQLLFNSLKVKRVGKLRWNSHQI